MRKLLLSGALIFFNRGSVSQLLVAMMIAFVALQLQLRVMPYKSFVANILQVVAFNAILLNLVGAMLLKVELPGMETGLGESFADGFLLLINVTVPTLVIVLLALPFGRDMYQLSVGRMVTSGLRARSRHAVMAAIAHRKATVDEHGAMELPIAFSKQSDGDDFNLHDERAAVQQRRTSHEEAATKLACAKAALAEKQAFYRFLAKQAKDETEFQELLANEAESLATYRSFTGAPLPVGEDELAVAVPNPLRDAVDPEQK